MEVLEHIVKLGLGGLGLAVFLFLIRDLIREVVSRVLPPEEAYKMSMGILWLTWITTMAALGVHTYLQSPGATGEKVPTISEKVASLRNELFARITEIERTQGRKNPVSLQLRVIGNYLSDENVKGKSKEEVLEILNFVESEIDKVR